MSMCNMSIEAGARAGLVAPDDITFSYLKGKPMAPKVVAKAILHCAVLSLARTGCHWLSLAGHSNGTICDTNQFNIPALAGSHWLSLALMIGSRYWLSLALIGSHWLSLLALIIGSHYWLSLALIGSHYWLSLLALVIGSHWLTGCDTNQFKMSHHQVLN